MIANVAGGVFMWAVHFLSKSIGPGEYGVFVACLGAAMVIPSIPLQMVLAQQTAKALATNRERELAGTIRLIWGGTFLLCLGGAIGVVVFSEDLMLRWYMTNLLALFVFFSVLLLSFFFPL